MVIELFSIIFSLFRKSQPHKFKFKFAKFLYVLDDQTIDQEGLRIRDAPLILSPSFLIPD